MVAVQRGIQLSNSGSQVISVSKSMVYDEIRE